MKIAVSIPDALFDSAEKASKRMRITRSELYQRALRAYVAQFDEESVSEALNELYGPGGEDSRLDPVLHAMQLTSLISDKNLEKKIIDSYNRVIKKNPDAFKLDPALERAQFENLPDDEW